MKYALRTFMGEIAVEFMPPRRRAKQDKVIILCDGMPTVPSKVEVLRFLSNMGYWVFYPRYRGTWESYGTFLRDSPAEDIRYVMRFLSHLQFRDVQGDVQRDAWYQLRDPRFILIGSSFGGAAALLASSHRTVDRTVAFSPVVDWQSLSEGKDAFDPLRELVRDGFGSAYNTDPGAWKRLESGTFFSPKLQASEMNGSKVLIVHAENDKSVDFRPVVEFAATINASLKLFKCGGHFGLSTLMKPAHWRRVQQFLSA